MPFNMSGGLNSFAIASCFTFKKAFLSTSCVEGTRDTGYHGSGGTEVLDSGTGCGLKFSGQVWRNRTHFDLWKMV